jgi:hypothetical protein
MEHDFQLHKRYSEGMRKLVKRKSVPKHGGKQGHLPPISINGGGQDNETLQLASELNLSSQDTINRTNTLEQTIDERKDQKKQKGSQMRQYAPTQIQTDLSESVL